MPLVMAFTLRYFYIPHWKLYPISKNPEPNVRAWAEADLYAEHPVSVTPHRSTVIV